MGNYSFLIYVFCLIILIIIGKVFIMPIKKVIKLITNSVLGIFFMYLVNAIGGNYGFHLGINWWTIIVSGILGVPGVILEVILKILL